jgi:hypothetical protein
MTTRPSCHPGRRHAGRGLCGACYHAARKRGLLPLLRELPVVLRPRHDFEGPRLRAVPAACPRCGNSCLRQYTGAVEINCPLCGWEAALVARFDGLP